MTMPEPTAKAECVKPETTELTVLLRELQTCNPGLSPFSKDVIMLFLELQDFKDDPEFHEVGFGLCCRFNTWKMEVEALTDRAGLSTLGEVGIVPGELWSLGWEYFQNQGRSTDLTDYVEGNIRDAVTKAMGVALHQPTSTARTLEMHSYVLSDSGVKVWKTPYAHPLLRDTDTTHPSFLDKLAETYSRGKVKGLPRILSENSEDARTWYYFSPLLGNVSDRNQALETLIGQAFPDAVPTQLLEEISSAELIFWPKLSPPPSRPLKEGASEPDILIRFGDQGIVLVEAKYLSDVSERTTYDETRDQVIRLIDIGSWNARQENLSGHDAGHHNSHVVVLQYGDKQTNAEEVVERYKENSEAIKKALPYRSDLTAADYEKLSRSVGFVRWPDPLN